MEGRRGKRGREGSAKNYSYDWLVFVIGLRRKTKNCDFLIRRVKRRGVFLCFRGEGKEEEEEKAGGRGCWKRRKENASFFCLVWFGLVWFGLVCFVLFCFLSETTIRRRLVGAH